MAQIVLATLNAKYIHASFGLRYLFANLGSLKSNACIAEFDINQRPNDIVELLLARDPKIIGFGVYIWNVAPTTEVVDILKRVRPDITIILGGPEVSYEVEGQPIVQLADHVITGEADLKFAQVCGRLLSGEQLVDKILPAEVPHFSQLALPYELYDAQDVAHRIIYVEASRGCPFTCEFCLSSLDIPVRQAPLPDLLQHLQRLLERGVKQFKFVDRTFNLNVSVSKTILQFFRERYQPGHFFHFEMIPDRLPEGLREVIAQFPPGALQFEVGIQTFNAEVGARIKRRQNYERLEDNFRFLRRHTGVHIHADLIVGLPGESVESFASGFDRLIALEPQEIQVGLLKRLRGTPIGRHDQEWQMVFNSHPPYEIVQNRLIDFVTMQKLKRFARFWDLVGNSGNFIRTTPLIWSGAGQGNGSAPAPAESSVALCFDPQPGPPESSPFQAFMSWSEWLHAQIGRTDSIALVRLMELLFKFLVEVNRLDPGFVAEAIWQDYRAGGRRDKPGFLTNFLPKTEPREVPRMQIGSLPKRQARHVAG
jgi:radical SAM superfamily enzyme YgiQ (UPF0313 family)